MHFWIDKRSQACGFGRARVAASLSSGGGLGFGHPRRIPRKSMVTPIHRFQTVDCTRPHPYRNQQQTQSPQQNSNHHQHYQQQQQQQQQSSNNQSHIQHHQAQLHSSSNNSGSGSGGHYNQHNSIVPAATQHQNHLHGQQQSQQLQQQHTNSSSYHVPVPVNHIYSNSSPQPNAIEIDHSGTLGTLNQHVAHVGHDAQLLPAHLKCGMWASLALATVFVAGAKFYFDHQGTGLEVLIFCAFSATFFLAACTVSLCRRPRDLQMPANNVISETISNAEQTSLQNNPDLMNGNPSPLLNGSVGGMIPANSLAVLAPPPPYHIAILLPESTKDLDETPPPSYDKILI